MCIFLRHQMAKIYIGYVYNLLMKLSSQNTSTSIYLQQIQNQIDLSLGYSKVRPYLFKELITADGSNPNSDDKLADIIVTKLTSSLNQNLHSPQKIDRTIKIIEDLLIHAQDIMTPVMHNQSFVTALINVALPKIITFNSKLDEYSRLRVSGMFMFWFDRYARQQKCDYEFFIVGYKHLRDRKMAFPDNPTIKPNDNLKKQLKSQNNAPSDNTTQVVLDDIEEFTKKTQFQFKENLKSVVNTQYVRLIKYKSKILFQFTQKGSTLNDKQKNTVKDLYKRLRNVLKQVQKINQNKLETKNSIKQQQAFVQQKMTPKKIEKEVLTPKNQEITSTPTKEPNEVKQFSKNSNSQTKKTQINTIDLLDIVSQPQENKANKEVIEQKLATPKKISTPNKKIESEAPASTNIDLLGNNINQKVPEVTQDEEFVQGTFVPTTQIQKSPQQIKQQQQEKMNKALFEVFSTPKKSNKDNQQEEDALAKNSSKKSNTESVQVQNEQNKKNKYSFIPHDLNLTPTSSNEDGQTPKKEGFGFNLFGLFGAKKQSQKTQDLYDQNKPYDYVPEYLMNKAQSNNQKSPITQAHTNQQLDSLNFYNFKPVKAVDYSQNVLLRSPSEHDEQQHFHPHVDFQNLQELAIESTEIKDKQGKQLIQSQD